MMWVLTVALLLVILGSGVADSEIKAVLVNRRSLLAGFVIGVATKVAVTLAPLGTLSTAQKGPPLIVPWLHVNETKFNGSGRGSPKTTPVAVSDPRLVSVMVYVMFSPIRTFFRSATLVSARSALSWAAAGWTLPPTSTTSARKAKAKRAIRRLTCNASFKGIEPRASLAVLLIDSISFHIGPADY